MRLDAPSPYPLPPGEGDVRGGCPRQTTAKSRLRRPEETYSPSPYPLPRGEGGYVSSRPTVPSLLVREG